MADNNISDDFAGTTSESVEGSSETPTESRSLIASFLNPNPLGGKYVGGEGEATPSTPESSTEGTPSDEASDESEDSSESEVEDTPDDEDEADATSEGDDDESSSEEDEDESTEDEDDQSDDSDDEEDAFFFVGEHSTYKDEDAAKRGIEAKDSFINEQKEQIERLNSDLTKAEQLNGFYSSNLDEDALMNAMVQNELPEEFRGKSEEDFEGEDLRNFHRAFGKAESDVNKAIAEAQTQAEQARVQKSERATEAREFVKTMATLDFFGVKNPEDRQAVQKQLSEKDEGGYDLRQKAALITEVFGQNAGEIFLTGVRESLGFSSASSTTESKTSESKPKSKSKGKTTGSTKNGVDPKVVEKVKKSKVVREPNIAPGSNQKAVPRSAKETLKFALASAGQR